MVKIVCISDTHNRLNKVEIPPGDILIHAGDLTMGGRIHECENELKKLAKLKDRVNEIIFVPGNHDWAFEKDPVLMREICKDLGIHLLIDQEIVLNDIKFYGSPITPFFCNWAFNRQRGHEIRKYWEVIPNDTQVLITHGPPYSFLDILPNGHEHVGCMDLFLRINQLPELKHHIFGHIHYMGGRERFWDGKHFVNAAICDEQYLPINKPVSFDFKEVCADNSHSS